MNVIGRGHLWKLCLSNLEHINLWSSVVFLYQLNFEDIIMFLESLRNNCIAIEIWSQLDINMRSGSSPSCHPAVRSCPVTLKFFSWVWLFFLVFCPCLSSNYSYSTVMYCMTLNDELVTCYIASININYEWHDADMTNNTWYLDK